jgi:hypothetical protein
MSCERARQRTDGRDGVRHQRGLAVVGPGERRRPVAPVRCAGEEVNIDVVTLDEVLADVGRFDELQAVGVLEERRLAVGVPLQPVLGALAVDAPVVLELVAAWQLPRRLELLEEPDDAKRARVLEVVQLHVEPVVGLTSRVPDRSQGVRVRPAAGPALAQRK